MKTCPNCNFQNEDMMKFCTECGTKLPEPKNHCPNCNLDWPINMKFCGECGFKFGGGGVPANNSGISMGDKNVIAGDVIGKKESYNVSGNATIVHNEDETKKTAKCHICGSVIQRIEGYDCPDCGHFTCDECFDKEQGICKLCVEKKIKNNEEQYKNRVIEFLRNDGRIDAEEYKILSEFASQLHIDPFRADEIRDEVKNNSLGPREMTTFEKINFEKAEELFYNQGKFDEAESLLAVMYSERSNDEKFLELYLPVLVKKDINAAVNLINQFAFDCLGLYIAKIQIAIEENDLITAEKEIITALRLWPENIKINCLRIEYCNALYEYTHSDEWIQKAEQILEQMESIPNVTPTKCELTWLVKMKCLINTLKNEEIPDITEEFCKDNGLYYYFLKQGMRNKTKLVVVGHSGDIDYSSIQEALNSVPENCTIQILPGIYEEDINISKTVKIIGVSNSIKDMPSSSLPIVVSSANHSIKLNTTGSIEGVVFTNKNNLNFSSLSEYVDTFEDIPEPESPSVWNGDNIKSILWVNSNFELDNIAVLDGENYGIVFSKGSPCLKNSYVSKTKDNCIYCVDKTAPSLTKTVLSNSHFPCLCSINNAAPFLNNIIVKNSLSDGMCFTDKSVGKIISCDIFNNKKSGISFAGEAKTLIKNSNIHENACHGLHIYGTSSVNVMECDVHDNSTSGPYSGILVQEGAQPTITGTKIYNHLAMGISMKQNSAGMFKENLIFKNKGSGICAADTSYGSFNKCEIYENNGNGVSVEGYSLAYFTNCLIHDNKMPGKTYPGIVVKDQSRPTVSACEVYNHSSYGILFKDYAEGYFTNNIIHNNLNSPIKNNGEGSPIFK